MTLQQRITSKVDFTKPQQVKAMVGTLYFYHQRNLRPELISTTEWVFDQVHHHTEFEWKKVLAYIQGVLKLMRRS